VRDPEFLATFFLELEGFDTLLFVLLFLLLGAFATGLLCLELLALELRCAGLLCALGRLDLDVLLFTAGRSLDVATRSLFAEDGALRCAFGLPCVGLLLTDDLDLSPFLEISPLFDAGLPSD
jgi:hypothetical protein